MENEPPPLPPEGDEPQTSSLFDRFLGVFAQPGQTFADLVKLPVNVYNWVVPLVLACLVGGAAVVAIFSQPAIVHKLQEQNDQAIEKAMKDVPPAQRQQAINNLGFFRTPTFFKIAGFAGVLLSTTAWLFLLALLLWVVARNIYKVDVDYMKAVEVCSLLGLIQVVGAVINTCVIIGTGNLEATVGPALFIRDFNVANKLHLALAACGVFSLWYAAVAAIGLTKLARCSLSVALPIVFIPWALFHLAIITLKARNAM